MIEYPIMTVTKVIKAPHPHPRGGDREMLATLEILNDGHHPRWRPRS
jgi:hypothetical protein